MPEVVRPPFRIDPARTALIAIDMQRDFCAAGGWVDQLGEDYTNTAETIPAVARVLAAARRAGLFVIHTREGHRDDLSDLPGNKQWRTRVHGLGIGDRGAEGRVLVRGEPGWQIVPEVAPHADETVIDKPGKSSFWATDLDRIIATHRIERLIVVGVTTDCCVQSTVRDAFDRGIPVTLVVDAVGAVERENHEAHIAILTRGRIPFAQAITVAELEEALIP